MSLEDTGNSTFRRGRFQPPTRSERSAAREADLTDAKGSTNEERSLTPTEAQRTAAPRAAVRPFREAMVSDADRTSAAEDLLSELKRVRKGRGLVGAAESRTVGPALAQLGAFNENDDNATRVAKLTKALSSLMVDLDESEAEAISAALAMGAEYGDLPMLSQRIDRLAAKLAADARTARRRIDDALAALAVTAVNSSRPISVDESAKRGWHARSVRTIVLLGSHGIEVLELRTVVSETLDLRRIYLGFSTPAPDGTNNPPQPRLQIDALYGGDIVGRKIETTARIGFALEFPRPLKLGEVYDYGVRFRLPPDADVAPYYVLTPWVMCDEFDLRVKFERIPEKVELLHGVLQADTQDSVLAAPAIEIDTLGEVRAKFRQLQPGMAYGVRWRDEPREP